jgi:hypothetical protein
MSEVALDEQWIQRCAHRLHARHRFPQEEARELASEAWQALGEAACPERAADELLGAAMPF